MVRPIRSPTLAFHRTFYWTPKFQEGGWRRSTILKIVESPYLNKKSSDFDEICHTTAHLELNDNRMTKYEFS